LHELAPQLQKTPEKAPRRADVQFGTTKRFEEPKLYEYQKNEKPWSPGQEAPPKSVSPTADFGRYSVRPHLFPLTPE
jgi:hypothetical protein